MANEVAAPGRYTSIDPRLEAGLATVGRIIRWVAFGYALLTMVGIVVDPLGDFPLGSTPVRDITFASAISLATLTLGALLAGDATQVAGGPGWRRVGLTMSLLAAGFGLVVLAVSVANRTDIWGDVVSVPAFSVGLVLFLLGVGVPLSVSRLESRVVIGQVAALLVFSMAAVIFLGYALGDPTVGRFFVRPQISLQAALVAVIAAVGVLLLRPGSGLLSTASSPGAGGRVLRVFGPIVLLMPALLMMVVELVPSPRRIDLIAFVSVGLGLFLLVLLAFFVKALDDTAIEASTQAARAERARLGLEQEAPVVSDMSGMFHIVNIEDLEHWEAATRFRPGFGSVEGDASAVYKLPDADAIGMVLVDMTGHGARPSIRAIRLRDLLLQTLIAGKTPLEAMELVEWSVEGDMLASAIVARLETFSGRVELCSAGHPPAIFVSAQKVSLKTPTGPLLYLNHSSLYEAHTFEMVPGDELIAFSDGVADVQLMREGKPEPERLAEMLLAEGGNAVRTAELVLGFAEKEPTDDQTVVVIRRTL